LAQSFTYFELIISDNASTDNTREICENFAIKDSRIKYHRQLINQGQAPNFEFVLEQASGKFFMWAAHDDLWSVNYLFECVSYLSENISIDFVFPKFKLQSIQLPLYKYIPNETFSFIDDSERRFRVINYLILHHYSHKCNIVYSFFRIDFIKSVYSIQDISNDGNLGMVILSLGRGFFHTGILFYKRYKKLWPGFMRKFYYYFSSKRIPDFEISKKQSKIGLLNIFPEYSHEISYVFEKLEMHNRHKFYLICSYEELSI
jgi:glycosyltransferase involved in cell wall biosynthesis